MLLSLSSCNIVIENKESTNDEIKEFKRYEPNDNFLMSKINEDKLSINNSYNYPKKGTYYQNGYFYVDNVKYYKYSYTPKDDLYDEYNQIEILIKEKELELDELEDKIFYWNEENNENKEEYLNRIEEGYDELEKIYKERDLCVLKIREYIRQRTEISYSDFKKALEDIPSEYKTYKDISANCKNKYNIKDNIELKEFDYNYYNGQLCCLISNSPTVIEYNDYHPNYINQILYFDGQEYAQMEAYDYNGEYNFKLENWDYLNYAVASKDSYVNFVSIIRANLANRKMNNRIEQFVHSKITNRNDYFDQDGIYMKEENGNIVKYYVVFDLVPYKPLRIKTKKINSYMYEINIMDLQNNPITNYNFKEYTNNVTYKDEKMYCTKQENYKIFISYEDENGPYLSSFVLKF